MVKDDHIYMIGGENGFLCLPGTPCPPYFNDVWKTSDGIHWEEVTPQAQWKKRPGHQVLVADDDFYLFGGFGLSENPFDPFAVNNPRDVWKSGDGRDWERISRRPWNALTQEEVKYDFDAISFVHPESLQEVIYTFGGDRETFDFTDPLNYLNVDNDVWTFCPTGCSVITAVHESNSADRFATMLYPTPAEDRVTLEFYAPGDGIASLFIYDLSGRWVSGENFPVSGGVNRHAFHVGGLAAGLYAIRLTAGNFYRIITLAKH